MTSHTIDRLFTLYWITWLVVGFGCPESLALITGQSQRTLSDHVWAAEGNGPTIVRYLVAAFCVWLTLHMVFKEFRVLR